jgi:hypothetical protein
MRPLPGIITPSIVSNSPPTRSRQAGHDADLILAFGLAVTEARHPR